MKRSEFLSRIVRTMLFAALALIGILLGSKTAKGKECGICSGYGKCNGETDCSKFKQANGQG